MENIYLGSNIKLYMPSQKASRKFKKDIFFYTRSSFSSGSLIHFFTQFDSLCLSLLLSIEQKSNLLLNSKIERVKIERERERERAWIRRQTRRRESRIKI
ncbi:hypothetical protein BpHYR1_023503 [Brachionus plicatilis]|uniref:Uncharacterized protein n=1 Tax=Brachionus plicatilis TaxID=10195 RepID=A0A3M7Q616_BRAPC|nr:hypothetical protein BpHYR1_023503 [Brachionus plicatilis]